jgi:predicted dehydrogenase
VVGSAKMAVYNDLAADERIRVFDKGVVRPETARTASDIPMSYRYGDISSPYIAFEEPLGVQDRHFVDCVLNGREPATPGENGLEVVRVLEAADRSLREGRPVRLADPAAARRRAALVGVPS